jgi:hypothetical protein
MHVRELVELAGLITVHGPVLIRCDETIPPESIEQYWTASKVRLDRWSRCLRAFTQTHQPSKNSEPAKNTDRVEAKAFCSKTETLEIRGVLEEIIAGELLTRVWTAVLCAYDRRRETNAVEPVARSVMLGHSEARHRVLTILTRGYGLADEEVKVLDHLRRHVERWIDMLLARFGGLYGVNEFAVDARRVEDFAGDASVWNESPQNRIAWPLALASYRASFESLLDTPTPNDDVNARIVGAILGCFPPELYHSNGVFRSLWMLRLSTAADDVQGMIDDLLSPLPSTDDILDRPVRLPRGRR